MRHSVWIIRNEKMQFLNRKFCWFWQFHRTATKMFENWILHQFIFNVSSLLSLKTINCIFHYKFYCCAFQSKNIQCFRQLLIIWYLFHFDKLANARKIHIPMEIVDEYILMVILSSKQWNNWHSISLKLFLCQ